jgi:cytohesin
MVLPKTEAEARALDAVCTSLSSQPSLAAVADLTAAPLALRKRSLANCARWDLANLARCALASGLSPDTRFGIYDTPVFCWAVRYGSASVLPVLLDVGANIELADEKGQTAAHQASFWGRAVCLRILLAAGADKEAKTELGLTPLHLATQQGHAECLRILLAAGADMDAKAVRGFAPLHCAAEKGRAETANLLLVSGCAVDARTDEQSTPLCYAANNGHLPVIKLLLARGANPNAGGVGGAPLVRAVVNKHAPCVAELLPVSDLSINSTSGRTVFHVCACVGSMECFELLLPLMTVDNVDVRTVPGIDDNGKPVPFFNCTPLHLACSFGQQAIVEALLRMGASRTARDSKQRTPLHYAGQFGYLTLAALLDDKPGRCKLTPDEVNAADVNGGTPLHYAARHGHVQCCGLLIAAGARLNATTNNGVTPLMRAQEFHPANAELRVLLAGGRDES